MIDSTEEDLSGRYFVTGPYHRSTVRVVGLTRGLGDLAELNPAELVAYLARVSNPENQGNHETSGRLLDFLRKHKHWSPFDMVNFVVETNTSRAIGRQFLRHWSIKPQETSQRYSELLLPTPLFWEARLAGDTNRQGSLELSGSPEHLAIQQRWTVNQTEVWDVAWGAYTDALRDGIASEVARAVLPEGMTPTTMYWNGTLRSWIHYFEQRLDSHTQKEHRELAAAVRLALCDAEPVLDRILPVQVAAAKF